MQCIYSWFDDIAFEVLSPFIPNLVLKFYIQLQISHLMYIGNRPYSLLDDLSPSSEY